MPDWTYDPRPGIRKYRLRGTYVSHAQVLEWAYDYAVKSGDVVASLSSLVANGRLRVDHWQSTLRNEIKHQFVNQYVAGKGGIQQMTQRDWGAVGRMLRDQYQFLDDFAADFAAGRLSEAQIQARARMYIEAGHQAFERGRAEAFGLPTLPAYPGDGQTTCLTRCYCNWDHEDVIEDGQIVGWNATWVLDPRKAEVHCPDCPANAKLWAPLFVPAGMTPAEARRWRAQEIEKMLAAR